MNKEQRSKGAKYTELSKNAILFTISNFGSKIISFLLVPLYTYVLSTKDYGNIDLINTTVQLLIPILTLNIQDAVLRFALDKKYKKNDVINVALLILLYSNLILIVFVVFMGAFQVFNLTWNYWLFLYFSFMFGSLFNVLSMYLKASDQVRVLAIFGILQTLITCFLNLWLLLTLRMGIDGYFIANTVGIGISDLGLFICGKVWKNLNSKKVQWAIGKAMLTFSMPLIINSVAWWINNASDRYVLTWFRGAAENGIYSVAYKIPSILNTVQSIFYSAWSISAVTQYDRNDKDGFVGNVYKIYVAFSILLSSLIMVLNQPLARFLYAKDFYAAWRDTPPLLAGTVFNGLALFDGCIFTAVKKTKEVSSTTLYGAVVNIVLNFCLIPWMGGLGAAIATMIGYLVTWIMRTWKMRKYIRMKVDWKIQLVALALLLIQSIVAVWFGVSWIQIPFFIILILIMLKDLKKLLRFIVNRISSIIKATH